MTKKLVLIDGNSLVHRAFHALPALSTSEGELVNAVYGFTSMLLKVFDELKPDYISVCFDLPGPTFRHKEFTQYKMSRPSVKEELDSQFSRIKEVLAAFNIPYHELESYEADDLLATLVEQAKKIQNLETFIVSGDLDLLQLVSQKVKVFTTKKGITDTVVYDEKQVEERYGLKPNNLNDL